jgi:4-amino-4-deoxychorismate lyase
MFRFFESIKVDQGRIWHWDLHWNRMQKTVLHHYKAFLDPKPILESLPRIPSGGKYKMRLRYDKNKFETELIPYQIRKINRLILIRDNGIDYSFKYTDRRTLNNLVASVGENEDVIVIKNNAVTDTSYTNLAFYRKGNWYTPAQPLLYGIKREYLISKGILKEALISEEALPSFSKVCLINAMLDLDELSVPIERVMNKIERIH